MPTTTHRFLAFVQIFTTLTFRADYNPQFWLCGEQHWLQSNTTRTTTVGWTLTRAEWNGKETTTNDNSVSTWKTINVRSRSQDIWFRAVVETSFGDLQEGRGYSPAVCPRLFEFLTTLTFGTQRRNHIASTPSVANTKKYTEIKKARRPHAISSLQ